MATEGSGYSIGHKERVPTDEGCGEGDWVALGDQQFRPAVVDDGGVPADARPDDDRRVARGTRESNWAENIVEQLTGGQVAHRCDDTALGGLQLLAEVDVLRLQSEEFGERLAMGW